MTTRRMAERVDKPIAILQHAPDVGPGYFATWLGERGLASEVIRIDRGEPVPRDPRRYAGICSLGGPMSVNDPLPWIRDEVAFLKAADAAGVPVIGHCLGGQLLAVALGARVKRHDVKEIGWGTLRVTDAGVAREWLGPHAVAGARFPTFQWHGDTFELPPGARNFLASDFCERQAYVVDRGRFAHLGFQFHCEMTPELVASWTDGDSELAEELAGGPSPSVQPAAEILRDLPARTAAINAVARRLYERWAKGLAN